MIYGYARISTPKQKITRQIKNIKEKYPEALIFEEVYTGSKFQGRDKLEKLLKVIKPGDTIVFDEASRMSRNAEEGYELYMELYKKGIHMVFLKEPQINSSTYEQATHAYIQKTNTAADILLKAIEEFILELAKEQIKMAFIRSEQELIFLRKRTKDGLAVAKAEGKTLGRKKDSEIITKRSIAAKEVITKHSKRYGGSLSVEDVTKLAGISEAQYYRYCKQIDTEAIKNEKEA